MMRRQQIQKYRFSVLYGVVAETGGGFPKFDGVVVTWRDKNNARHVFVVVQHL